MRRVLLGAGGLAVAPLIHIKCKVMSDIDENVSAAIEKLEGDSAVVCQREHAVSAQRLKEVGELYDLTEPQLATAIWRCQPVEGQVRDIDAILEVLRRRGATNNHELAAHLLKLVGQSKWFAG